MQEKISIRRTNSADKDFNALIAKLDHELWNELMEDQATYDQYNKVPGLQTAVVLYINEKPVACGCFKTFNVDTVEIKRMFVEKEYRGRGFSRSILRELEAWAIEYRFQYAVLETSVHFKVARNLYLKEGYAATDNYGQYAGLEESICMKKTLPLSSGPSEFKNQPDIEYFLFEEEFIEENVRCIPMIVRFKMDKAGIKLKLAEWCRFPVNERIALAKKSCNNDDETREYNRYLTGLIKTYTGNEATAIDIDKHPAWANLNTIV
jgi:putative acetyltransferase